MKLDFISKNNSKKYFIIIIFTLIISNIGVYSLLPSQQTNEISVKDANTNSGPPYNGVDMHGFYTRTAQARDSNYDLPNNYFEESFKILSNNGFNHVRFPIFWESFVKNPEDFINELKIVANAADKYNINVLYDNHQFHTSSYLNPQRGTGFPFSLFESDFAFFYGSGGGTKYPTAKVWWSNWWDRNVRDQDGNDGWILQTEFFKKILETVDNHTSTVGYEILSEPQVHDKNQWEKIGKYNTFMADFLRQHTDKTIAYSMNIPVSLQSPIELTPMNLAKMAPQNTSNVVFKISVYGVPQENPYQESRLSNFVQAAEFANVPLYVGEWNNVQRDRIVDEEGEIVTFINETFSSINQTEANILVDTFKNLDVWGSAFWQWRVDSHQVQNFNLINVTNGKIETTTYFNIVKTAYQTIYGNTSQAHALTPNNKNIDLNQQESQINVIETK
jgi:Cellulase (glycosyl hydrolase family 5)